MSLLRFQIINRFLELKHKCGFAKRRFLLIVKLYTEYYIELLHLKKKSSKIIVFQWDCVKPGLCSYFCHYLGFSRWAVTKGFVPVIDMKTNDSIYVNTSESGKINVWETFFRQPCHLGLNDIKGKDFSIIHEDPSIIPWGDWNCLRQNRIECKLWRLYTHKYMRYSDTMLREIDRIYNQLINKTDRVLGVLCRGTDYVHGRPFGHPIQPTAEEVIKKINEILQKGRYTKVFLATEDNTILSKFEKEYPDLLITNSNKHIDYIPGSWIGDCMPKDTEDKLYQGVQYLVSIAKLSRCNAFIGGRTSGTVAAMLLSKGFEYTYFWDLGSY